MSPARVGLASLSAAMDGGFTAIADVSEAMSVAGAEGDYRLIGGVTVMLHIQRLGLDLPLRATGDAATTGSSATDGNGNSMSAESRPSTCSCLRTARVPATRSR